MRALWSGNHLEMRCPGRGRKPGFFDLLGFSNVFGNEMPRKGTETRKSYNLTLSSVVIWK